LSVEILVNDMPQKHFEATQWRQLKRKLHNGQDLFFTLPLLQVQPYPVFLKWTALGWCAWDTLDRKRRNKNNLMNSQFFF
jgi:hypothetical protein